MMKNLHYGQQKAKKLGKNVILIYCIICFNEKKYWNYIRKQYWETLSMHQLIRNRIKFVNCIIYWSLITLRYRATGKKIQDIHVFSDIHRKSKLNIKYFWTFKCIQNLWSAKNETYWKMHIRNYDYKNLSFYFKKQSKKLSVCPCEPKPLSITRKAKVEHLHMFYKKMVFFHKFDNYYSPVLFREVVHILTCNRCFQRTESALFPLHFGHHHQLFHTAVCTSIPADPHPAK